MKISPALAKRMQPLIAAFAGEVVELVQRRIDGVISEAEAAIENAISLIAAELEGPPVDSGQPRQSIPKAKPVEEIVRRVPELTATRGVTADALFKREIASKSRPAAKPSTAPAPAPRLKVEGKVTCKKCGFVGGNARGCGTAHVTVTADAENNDVERWSSDRIAQIKAQAEANKHAGKLPRPSSSFEVDQEERVAGMAAVRELEVDEDVAELDFEERG